MIQHKGTVILNTNLVMIVKEDGHYRVFLPMQQGGVVEHAPFPGDQRGLVAAMSLATDVLAGKVWLKQFHIKSQAWDKPEPVQIESTRED